MSRHRRPASLRVPALILRFLTMSRMSFSLRLLCSGQIRVIQHPQQFVPVALEALEDLIERFAGGDRSAQGVELGVDGGFRRRGGQRAIGIQVPIEGPDLLPNPGNGDPIRLVRGEKLLQGPLGMHPAQGMDERGQIARRHR